MSEILGNSEATWYFLDTIDTASALTTVLTKKSRRHLLKFKEVSKIFRQNCERFGKISRTFEREFQKV